MTRNRAVASRPYGRFAEGAGVNITSTPFFLRPRRRISTLTIDASRITANAATLADGFTSDVEAHANTGGVLIAGDDDCSKPTSGCVRGTIHKSLVSGNTATAGNTAGDATAFGGGIVVDGVLVLSRSTIRNNHVRVKVPAGSTAGAFGDSAGIGMGGYATITDSRLIGNSVSVKAPGGTASAIFAGLSVGNGAFATTITHSDISRNQLAASTTSGSVTLQGAGIGHLNGAPLVLRDTTVARNLATGNGPGGIDQGGWHLEREPGPVQFPRAASPDRQHGRKERAQSEHRHHRARRRDLHHRQTVDPPHHHRSQPTRPMPRMLTPSHRPTNLIRTCRHARCQRRCSAPPGRVPPAGARRRRWLPQPQRGRMITHKTCSRVAVSISSLAAQDLLGAELESQVARTRRFRARLTAPEAGSMSGPSRASSAAVPCWRRPVAQREGQADAQAFVGEHSAVHMALPLVALKRAPAAGLQPVLHVWSTCAAVSGSRDP